MPCSTYIHIFFTSLCFTERRVSLIVSYVQRVNTYLLLYELLPTWRSWWSGNALVYEGKLCFSPWRILEANEPGHRREHKDNRNGRWEWRWVIIIKCLLVIRMRLSTKIGWKKYSDVGSEWEERKGAKNNKASLCNLLFIYKWPLFFNTWSAIYYKVQMCLVTITVWGSVEARWF